MKKIYFKGYYGYKNLGDDIFAVTAEWICNNLWNNCTPIIIGKDLPIISKGTKRIEIKNELLRRGVELVVCLFVHRIIYFGGSLFSGGGSGYKDLKFYLRKIPFLYKKTGAIGTSIGPFDSRNDYDLTRDLLNKFKFNSVRDYSSVQIADEMEVKSSFCFDNAILIKEVYPKLKDQKRKSDKIKIAISLCRYESYNGKDLKNEQLREEAIKQFLNEILKKYNNIEEFVFIVFNGSSKIGDLKITKQFSNYFNNRVKTRIVDYTNNTEEMINEMNNCDFVFGVRLHSGILAYALEIPFMLVEYHPKCTEFLNTINHNFRFNINNTSTNLQSFDIIQSQYSIPDIKSPDVFKDIMISELKDIEKLI
ncbi:polysaccharide pyruvyl transferase family protein [Neobacillus sp. DY30]|uniref:polysaccharide pyruvyl transferase family protein n=1 Tax=Neobacillus sp. DY30 TaxID=3047871 RepID=UPI0024BF893F|nr:polysaccharide pyruvyl transferase family protein [Neobacillus sp. DY30]WHY00415.1 polysaccharide pyruvyl transferase family protein [Neobacillus sp. DY30]